MWWHVNFFWFHTGCDILSGLFQVGSRVEPVGLEVMPVLTDLYTRMSWNLM